MHRALLLLLIGCGGGTVNPDEEVSIPQGVYGLAISYCDTPPCENHAIDGALISATPGGGSTTTDEGFFELELPAGTFELCKERGACTPITIVEGQRVRRDFQGGPGGGFWCGDGECPLD